MKYFSHLLIPSSRVAHTVRRFLRGASFLAAFGAAAFVLPDNARANDNENLSSCPIGAPPGTEPDRDNLRPPVGDTASAKQVSSREVAITGVVKDEAGKPIKNAEILASSLPYSGTIPPLKTDADGKFRFACGEGRTVWLKVLANGFAPDSKKIILSDKAANLEFVLKSAKTIKGVAFDDDGKPLAGVTLRLKALRYGEELSRYFNDGKTQTDSQGRFIFENMPEDKLEVQVEDSEKGNFFRETFPIRSDKENKIVATRAKTEFRIVKVLDAQTGEPVSGFVETNISPEKPNESLSQYWKATSQVPFIATWGEKLPKDVSKVKLTVRVHGYKEKVITGLSLEDKRQDFVVKLERNPFARRKGEPRKPVELQIFTPEGKPAADAWVRHSAPISKQIVEKYPKGRYADKNGKVELPPMYTSWEQDTIRKGGNPDEEKDTRVVPFYLQGQPQSYLVEINHNSGYLQTVISEETAGKPVTLQKWAKIKGKVLVGDKPVVGAKVYLGKDTLYQMLFDLGESLAVTDKDGVFELTKIKAGQNYVSVESDGVASQRLVSCKSGETAEITIGGQGRPLTAKVSVSELSELFDIDATFRLPEEMKISGVKVFRNKQPLFLYLTPVLDKKEATADKINATERESDLLSYSEKEQEAVAKQQQVKIGEDGTMRFENVIPGKYRLVAKPVGQIEAASAPFAVTLGAEKNFDTKAQDLGVVKLERKKIHAGVSFPNFAFQQGMQDKTRISSEFVGKTWMLLLFDANSSEGIQAYGNVLGISGNGVTDLNADEEKVKILALHCGKKTKGFKELWVKSYWAEPNLGWLTKEQEQAFSSFGLGDETPQYFLIDKDGKVAATGFNNILEWSSLKKTKLLPEIRTALRGEFRKAALEANAKR
jgi:uncharacterized GH25 family protein